MDRRTSSAMLPYRYFKRSSDHRAAPLGDLIAAFQQKTDHKGWFVFAALAIPTLIIIGFTIQFTEEKEYHPPEVIFFKNWRLDRSDAEIRRQLAIDGPRELAERKAQEEAEAKHRADMRAVAEAMGYDVDNGR